MKMRKEGTITYYDDLEQGSVEWLQARGGVLTASCVKLILTPTLKVAKNDKIKAHIEKLTSERITGFVDEQYQSRDMIRGHMDEIRAREIYDSNRKNKDIEGELHHVGFIVNDEFGYRLGYSPDGLIGDKGLCECKSRLQKLQMRDTIEFLPKLQCPTDHVLQVQAGLIVTKREWCDLISYCGGMRMFVIRVYPDRILQDAIITAGAECEKNILNSMGDYAKIVAIHEDKMIQTEREFLEII